MRFFTTTCVLTLFTSMLLYASPAQDAPSAALAGSEPAASGSRLVDEMSAIVSNRSQRDRSWIDPLQYTRLAKPLAEKYSPEEILNASDVALPRHPDFYGGILVHLMQDADVLSTVSGWIAAGKHRFERPALYRAMSYAPPELLREAIESLLSDSFRGTYLRPGDVATLSSLLAIVGDRGSLPTLVNTQRSWRGASSTSMHGQLSAFLGDGQFLSGDIDYLRSRLNGPLNSAIGTRNKLELQFFRWNLCEDPLAEQQAINHFAKEMIADRMRSHSVDFPLEFLRTKYSSSDRQLPGEATTGTGLAIALAEYDDRRRKLLHSIAELAAEAEHGDSIVLGELLRIDDPAAVDAVKNLLRSSIGDLESGQSLNQEVVKKVAWSGGEEIKQFLQELSQDPRLSKAERTFLSETAASMSY